MKQAEAPVAARLCSTSMSSSRSSAALTANAGARLAVRRRSRSLVADLEIWMRQQRAYSPQERYRQGDQLPSQPLGCIHRFLDDGRVCLEQRCRTSFAVAIGRRSRTFAGSDAGGHRAAAVYTLVETCKMNDVDPQAWLCRCAGPAPRLSAKSPTCCVELARQARRRCLSDPQRIAPTWGAG